MAGLVFTSPTPDDHVTHPTLNRPRPVLSHGRVLFPSDETDKRADQP
jgi:hypothetical protein